tara:strand:+ start:397 stop:1125 length:729 start_codon:yes stop_codon:yes gene_type:complete
MISECLILCGGKGTRLKQRTKKVPKVLAKIKKKPFLHYQLEWLEMQKIKKVYLLTKYRSNLIEKFVNENKNNYKLDIIIFKEKQFLGTGGSLKNFYKSTNLTYNFLVINGDTFFNIKKIKSFFKLHLNNNHKITIGASKIFNADRYGEIIRTKNKFIKIVSNNNMKKTKLVFSGLIIIKLNYLLKIKENIFQLEDFLNYSEVSDKVKIYCFKNKPFFYDFGTIESYDAVSSKGFFDGSGGGI